MDNNTKKILVITFASVCALICALLTLSLYQLYTAEQLRYEQTNAEPLLQRAAEAEESVLQRMEKEKEQAAQKADEERKQRIESRCEVYTQSLLTLVGPWNTVPETYTAYLSTVEKGYLIHRRCAQALTDMINDCRGAGNQPVICSAYRTQEYQEELYRNKILRLLASGVPNAEAPAIAARSVAIPGTSEHQLGLAVDIIDENYVNLDQYQQYTQVQKWLMEHCSDYGFILRYPNGSSDITGIIFEPWHYRYVGVSTAKAIEASGLVYEEYLKTLQ